STALVAPGRCRLPTRPSTRATVDGKPTGSIRAVADADPLRGRQAADRVSVPTPPLSQRRRAGLATTHEVNRLWNVQVRSSYPYTHLTRSFSTHSRGLAQGSWRAIQRRRVMMAAQPSLDERDGGRARAIQVSPSTDAMTIRDAMPHQSRAGPSSGESHETLCRANDRDLPTGRTVLGQRRERSRGRD